MFLFSLFLCIWTDVVESSGSCYTLWLISLHTMNSRDWKDCSNELNTLTHVCVHACEMCISRNTLQLSTQTHLTCNNLTKCDQFRTIRTGIAFRTGFDITNWDTRNADCVWYILGVQCSAFRLLLERSFGLRSMPATYDSKDHVVFI